MIGTICNFIGDCLCAEREDLNNRYREEGDVNDMLAARTQFYRVVGGGISGTVIGGLIQSSALAVGVGAAAGAIGTPLAIYLLGKCCEGVISCCDKKEKETDVERQQVSNSSHPSSRYSWLSCYGSETVADTRTTPLLAMTK